MFRRGEVHALTTAIDTNRVAVNDGEHKRVVVQAAKLIDRGSDSNRLIEGLRQAEQRHRTDVVAVRVVIEQRKRGHGEGGDKGRNGGGPAAKRQCGNQKRDGEHERRHRDHQIGPKAEPNPHDGARGRRQHDGEPAARRADHENAHDEHHGEEKRALGVVPQMRREHQVWCRHQHRDNAEQRQTTGQRQPEHPVRKGCHGANEDSGQHSQPRPRHAGKLPRQRNRRLQVSACPLEWVQIGSLDVARQIRTIEGISSLRQERLEGLDISGIRIVQTPAASQHHRGAEFGLVKGRLTAGRTKRLDGTRADPASHTEDDDGNDEVGHAEPGPVHQFESGWSNTRVVRSAVRPSAAHGTASTSGGPTAPNR